MENINFTYTRDQQEANQWDLNLKFVSSEGVIFYTARLFFRKSKYFQTLFASAFKENKDNVINLTISAETLEKYFLILSRKGHGLTFTDQELVDLIELGDQQDLQPLVDYLIDPVVEREMISAEDLFRLVNIYNLEVSLEVGNLIHLEGIADHLDQLEEPMVWDCFDLACSNLHLCKIYKQESRIEPEEYKRIILACYDRFPDKAEMFRDHARKYLAAYPAIPEDQRKALVEKLGNAGLLRRDWIFSFRKELEASLDVILNF